MNPEGDQVLGADPDRPTTVSELTAAIKDRLEDNFDGLWVEGEISNFTAHRSGHWYFTLKDRGAQLPAVMFRNRNQRSTRPSSGDRVLARGRISVYAPHGRYQLICDQLRPAGAGDLWQRFQALKEQLAAEGLFAEERKRPLPEVPEAIGLVTSADGAALQDMLRVVGLRNPSLRVVLRPTRVQGAGAAEDVAAGLAELGALPDLDLIVIGRGGGSLEDLWAFNEEVVARAVAACARPVVSAVGHESDVLISDLVADLRAPTPTAAIEWVVPDREGLREELGRLADRLAGALAAGLDDARQRLELARLKLVDPRRRIVDRRLALDGLFHRLDRVGTRQLGESRQALVELRRRLEDRAPTAAVNRARDQLTTEVRNLERGARAGILASRSRLEGLAGRLEALSPLGVLERGYAIVRREADGAVLRSAGEVAVGEAVEIRVHRGRLGARVEEVDEGGDTDSATPGSSARGSGA